MVEAGHIILFRSAIKLSRLLNVTESSEAAEVGCGRCGEYNNVRGVLQTSIFANLVGGSKPYFVKRMPTKSAFWGRPLTS